MKENIKYILKRSKKFAKGRKTIIFVIEIRAVRCDGIKILVDNWTMLKVPTVVLF